ncbi:hypothetical protein Bbelb_415920 [Branchiostoma belcheri]|nr:hypothetical protein Bbelb_415920 [Branchiostoma belcheri]
MRPTRDVDPRRDLRRLREQASRTKWAAFADGTWANLRTILRTFLLFCTFYCIPPFPASVDTLETYVEFLARSFQAPASIGNYLAGLKTLHILFGYATDAFLTTDITLLKRGLQRRMGHTPRQVAPFTPEVLLQIYEHLDIFRDPFHATIWTLLLLSFFTFQPVFDKAFKCILERAGLNPHLYSLHSGRRGGATFAFRAGVPVELIRRVVVSLRFSSL